MRLRQLIISADSPFVGKTLKESDLRRTYNCMVVGLEEGRENLSLVNANYRFAQGDILWVVGESDDLERISASLRSAAN